MRINRSHTRREELEGKECTFAPVISERSRLLAETRGRSTPEGTLRLTSGGYGMACLDRVSHLRELVDVCDRRVCVASTEGLAMHHLHSSAFLLIHTHMWPEGGMRLTLGEESEAWASLSPEEQRARRVTRMLQRAESMHKVHWPRVCVMYGGEELGVGRLVVVPGSYHPFN